MEGELWAWMRDPALSDALTMLAAEAATRFSSLVATGEEIPFDLTENSGPGSHFYGYRPLTARFVADHEDQLRSLPAFAAARDAVSSCGVDSPYLEARGMTVPTEPVDRAETMLLVFIAALWDGSAEFSLDRPRLAQALRELDAETRDPADADVLLVPIVGLKMALPHLRLPSGVRIVRADTVEVPPESIGSEGMQRAAWAPQFLALADQGELAEGGAAAMRQLHELISVMRLFKEGGIGLGPYAFAPTGEGKWRRVATRAPATRAGGYELSEPETVELAEFAHELESRPDPDGALGWAISRFEMGCARSTPMAGISDHLLALRAILESEDGPVGASLPMRASALIADGADRDEARLQVEHAFELERALMNGDEPGDRGDDRGLANAMRLAAWLEEGVRAVLRDAALGELGTNLGDSADKALISAGLEGGGVSPEQMGATAEWEALTPESNPQPEPEIHAQITPEDESDQSTRILEPIPLAGDEIRVIATAVEQEPAAGDEHFDDEYEVEGVPRHEGPSGDQQEERLMINRDWLSEVKARDATLEWPAVDREGRPRKREPMDTPRDPELFPVPEEADWEVRELTYDRSRARVS